MRTALALLFAAGLAATAFAQDTKPATPAAKPATAPAAAQPAGPAVAPDAPPAPKAIPVPDGPVIKKTELDGGLIVEDIKIGDGYEVKPGGAIVAHYHGTLKETGKVFQSSFDQGGPPLVYPLSGLMEGFQKGIPGMKVGGVRKLTVPAALGYGAAGAGETIPPNSDLVFIVELLDAMQIEDTKVGDGEAVSGTSVVATTHVIKDAAGKEIEKCDKPYIWIPNEFQPISVGLEGMKVGGKRKLVVPKQFNQTNPQLNEHNRANDVPITIELELISVRNLPRQPRGAGGR